MLKNKLNAVPFEEAGPCEKLHISTSLREKAIAYVVVVSRVIATMIIFSAQ